MRSSTTGSLRRRATSTRCSGTRSARRAPTARACARRTSAAATCLRCHGSTRPLQCTSNSGAFRVGQSACWCRVLACRARLCIVSTSYRAMFTFQSAMRLSLAPLASQLAGSPASSSPPSSLSESLSSPKACVPARRGGAGSGLAHARACTDSRWYASVPRGLRVAAENRRILGRELCYRHACHRPLGTLTFRPTLQQQGSCRHPTPRAPSCQSAAWGTP